MWHPRQLVVLLHSEGFRDCGPVASRLIPNKEASGAHAHPAGAVVLLSTRVAALRAGENRVPKTRRCLCRTVTERCLDCTAAFLVDAEAWRRRPRQRPHDHRRGEFSESGSDGQSASEESGADTGMSHDTRVRHVARKLEASTIVSFAFQVGYPQATGELEAAANVQRLAVSYLDRALLAQAGPRFPVPTERELRTLAETLDALLSGQIMTATIEASAVEEGGWNVARRLEVVPETRVSSVTPGLLAKMAAAERQSRRLKQDLWRRPRDPHWKPWSGYMSSGRVRTVSTDMETPTTCPVQWTQPLRRKRERAKAKEKSKGGNRKKAGRLV